MIAHAALNYAMRPKESALETVFEALILKFCTAFDDSRRQLTDRW